MNIAIRADGSKEIGLGHIVRCYALAEAFVEAGDEVTFFCSSKQHGGIDWLKQQKCNAISLHSNNIECEVNELIAHLVVRNINVVVLDSYSLSSEYIRKLTGHKWIVVAVDDNCLYDYHCDIVVNGNLGAEDISYPVNQIGMVLQGGKYAMLRKEFAQIDPAPLREQVKDILVTMGGSDPNNCTPLVLRGLSHFGEVTIHVVVGGLMSNLYEIESAAKECKGKVLIHNQPESMAQLMSECDLAISAGGGTARELFAMGLFSLFIIQAENQLALFGFFDNAKVPLCLGYYSDVYEEEIHKVVEGFIAAPSLRRQYREFMLSKVDRRGSYNVVKEIRICFQQLNRSYI